MEVEGKATDDGAASRGPWEVFLVFLGLGLTSFGGPVAHLGYYERTLVARRKWLTTDEYAATVALCQVLPGPTSSQVGIAIGKQQAGLAGSLAAWAGFTLPSAILMGSFAFVVDRIGDVSNADWLHGLKIAAVAIVAQAILSMWGSLAPDRTRSVFACLAAIAMLLWMTPASQILVLAAGAIAGWALLSGVAGSTMIARSAVSQSNGATIGLLGAFAGTLLLLPILARQFDYELLALADLFSRTGALVFGGGHVVLPLLQAETVPAFVTNDQFLAGYGFAQAMPGPLFTFATYLGASSAGIAGGIVATVAIYVPSFLLVWGIGPVWERIGGRTGLQGALRGVNAAVIGILVAAFYDPILTTAVIERKDAAAAIGLFGILQFLKAPPWTVVALSVVLGIVFW